MICFCELDFADIEDEVTLTKLLGFKLAEQAKEEDNGYKK
jgi:hypothetical protein